MEAKCPHCGQPYSPKAPRLLPPVAAGAGNADGKLEWTLTFSDSGITGWTPEEETAFIEHRFYPF